MACSFMDRVHQYRDNELSLPDRESFEVHLVECCECRQLLNDLRRLSVLISAAPLAESPPHVVRRLHRSWQRTHERGIVRIAGWLTAAAAAVLVGALLWPAERSDAPVWQTLAVMSPVEVREGANSEFVLAQWMADDLSSDQEGSLR